MEKNNMTIFEYLGIRDHIYRDDAGNAYVCFAEMEDLFGCWNFAADLGDGTGFISKEQFEQYERYSISAIEEDERFSYLSEMGRLYYRLVGKSVTKDQVFDVIRRTDRLFEWHVEEIRQRPEFVRGWNFDNGVLDPRYWPGCGWMHVDGSVWCYGNTQKHPTIPGLILEWLTNLIAFPYLDLIVAVTEGDVGLSAKTWNCSPEPEAPFDQSVLLGIYVHDRTIAVLDQNDTLERYRTYAKRYGCSGEKAKPEYEYFPYLRRCIESYGVDADAVLSRMPDYIWKGANRT